MKKIAFVLLLVMVVGALVACGNTTTVLDPENETEVETIFADLAKLPEHVDLYYSVNTRTVYYVHDSKEGRESIAFMAPYIVNGHFCEYVDGEIVEVTD